MNYYQLNNITLQQQVFDSLIPSSVIIFTPPQEKNSKQDTLLGNSLASIYQSHSAINSKIKTQTRTFKYKWKDVHIDHFNNQTQQLFQFKDVDEFKEQLNNIVASENQDQPINETKNLRGDNIYQSQVKTLLEDIQEQTFNLEQSFEDKKERDEIEGKYKFNVELNIQQIKESHSVFCIQGQFYMAKYAICLWKGKQSILILLTNDSIERKNKQLEKINEYKDRLLATVSHDLKTPLNSIISITDFLQREISQSSSTLIPSEANNFPINTECNGTIPYCNGVIPQKNHTQNKKSNYLNKKSFKKCKSDSIGTLQNSSSYQKYLKIIYSNSLMLLSIINDILDYSQLNYSKLRKIKLHITRFDLQELILEVFDIFQFQMYGKNISLLISTKQTSLCIWSDRNRIKQILMNFISNAIKFTFEGYVKISIITLPDINKIGIKIEDTGVGMSSEIQENLFKEFGTFNQYNLNTNGIGLGLVICKKFIEVLGDENGVKVESKEGKGSSFYFQLNIGERQSQGIDQIEKKKNKQHSFLPMDIYSSINNTVGSNTYSPKTKSINQNNVDFNIESHEGLTNFKESVNPQQISSKYDANNSTYETQKKGISFDENFSHQFPDQKIFINFSQEKASMFQKGNNVLLIKNQKMKEIEVKKNPKFMIVDDCQFNLISLKVQLQQYSNEIQIDEFLDARKAYEAIQTQVYDAVFTDVQMPIMNGIKFVELIRNLKNQIIQPKVVLVSAGNEEFYEKEIKFLNIFQFLSKPILDKKAFGQLINLLLKKQSKDEDLQNI